MIEYHRCVNISISSKNMRNKHHLKFHCEMAFCALQEKGGV